MKPAPFEYVAPDSVDGVVAALAEHGDEAKIVAGGQSLFPMMAMRLARPAVLVDVGRVAELQRTTGGAGLRVGAAVTQSALHRDPVVRQGAPLVAEVVPLIAHDAIRNRGTIGGSLAHADPAAELPAVALLCGAELVVVGPRGERVVPAADFFVSYLTTDLAPDEVLVAVRFPPAPTGTGTAFREISRRHGDFALVGAGGRIVLDDGGRIVSAALAFVGVDSVPVLDDLTAVLAGAEPTPGALADAARAAAAALEPSDDIHATAAYRRHVAGVLAAAVLVAAAGASRGAA